MNDYCKHISERAGYKKERIKEKCNGSEFLRGLPARIWMYSWNFSPKRRKTCGSSL
jgi:hypothetical protein